MTSTSSSTGRRTRFADTSFWFALHSPRDRHYQAASRLVRGETAAVLTSNHVVGETWNLLRRRVGHHAAVAFLDVLDRSRRIEVAFITPDIEAQAWAWLRRHDEREYSFVDATSFALMRRRGLTEALAFDGDFAAGGFIELRPA